MLTLFVLAATAFLASGYFYWQKIDVFSVVLNFAANQTSVAPATKTPPAFLSPEQPSGPVSEQTITEEMPDVTIPPPASRTPVSEKIILSGNPINETISPRFQEIPPVILEEKSPGETALPPAIFESDFSPAPPVLAAATSSEIAVFQSEETPQDVDEDAAVPLSNTDSLDMGGANQNVGDIPVATSTPPNATSTDAGNSEEIPASTDWHSVAINEVAWAGTGTSSKATSDEWIELCNKTSQPVQIIDWRLTSSDEKGPDIVLATSTAATTTISANGFYLIERTDEGATSEPADWTGSFGNGLGNNPNCEILSLYDAANNLIDQTACLANGNWPAGSASPDYQSMERVNPYLASDVPDNWQSNSTSTRNGLNVDCQPVNGTPKAPNSVLNLNFLYLYPAQNITATSTLLSWTPSFMPDFQNYKILRSTVVGSSTVTSTLTTLSVGTAIFFDQSLASETSYNYEIQSCDSADNCFASNIVSVQTPPFPFLWAEPQRLANASTSSPPQIYELSFDGNNQPVIVWSDATTTPDISSSTQTLTILNATGQPYTFWVATSSAIYFSYTDQNQKQRPSKKIFEFPFTIKDLRAIISPANEAYLAWRVESENAIFSTFSKIE